MDAYGLHLIAMRRRAERRRRFAILMVVAAAVGAGLGWWQLHWTVYALINISSALVAVQVMRMAFSQSMAGELISFKEAHAACSGLVMSVVMTTTAMALHTCARNGAGLLNAIKQNFMA